MSDLDSNDSATPIGHAWLRREFALNVPAPSTESYIVQGARRTTVRGRNKLEFYPRQYATDDSVVANLRFALRHEPTDLGCLIGALQAMNHSDLQNWVHSEPTGAFSRRAWFFYERFSHKTLSNEDVRVGNYVDAIDSNKHVVAFQSRSSRHRVNDNLLGGPGLCVTVRLTETIKAQMQSHIDAEARALVESHDPVTLARAVNYLYTKETRSSFAIEGETPNASRAERFVAVLKAAPSFVLDKRSLIKLQGEIVDARYAASDWRDFQNFVGETVSGWREEIHYICPQPHDVAHLMDGWVNLVTRVINRPVDPVIAAAILAFSFVFIHPFADGNGRIHRFIMHHVLAKRGYSPEGLIFPVSAAILRDRRSYDDVLETFSKPIMNHTNWAWTPDQEIEVQGETLDLYRYFDATAFAEYLYDRVADTVRKDLKEELGFVAIFDRAFDRVRDLIDMPDRKASLFIRLCLQNGGTLSKSKRGMFSELSDVDIGKLESIIQRAIDPEGGNPMMSAKPPS